MKHAGSEASGGNNPWGTKQDVEPTAGKTEEQNQAGSENRGGGRGQRPSRRNKKVYKVVDLASFAPEPSQWQQTIATPDIRFPTNGVPPIAIRNPEYAPVYNRSKTFSNVFENLAKPTPKNFEMSQFSIKDEEFPSLKK